MVSDQRQGRMIQCRANYRQMSALLGFLNRELLCGNGRREWLRTRDRMQANPEISMNNDHAQPMTGIKRVLFVCIENSNRSQMAEAFAHIHGGNHIVALSASSRPSGVINPKAIRFMQELKYDHTTHTSKSLDEVDGEFDAVITMGCGDACPLLPARHREDRALPDPKHMDDGAYRIVRDEIAARVRALLTTLR